MKRFLAFLFLIFIFLLFTNIARAEIGWRVENFDSKIDIEATGKVRVVESIDVDFGSLQKHGIFRYIPVEYQDQKGQKTYTEIEILKVGLNGKQVKYEATQSAGYLQIKIGDPDKTVVGEQSYQIEYVVTGVLLGYQEYDELYWNVTGNAWEVPIEKVSTVVTLPSDGVIQTFCYQGASGSTENCEKKEESATQVSFASTRPLSSSEGLTVALGYRKGLVPILKVEAPKTVVSVLFTPLNLVLTILVVFVGVLIILRLWWKSGRDFWLRSRFLDDPASKHEVKPTGAHETVVVEYEPPGQLRPAEIGALLDERADTLDVTATLVDLANRGYLTIGEEAKKWMFGSTDYILSKKKIDETGLLNYEKELLDRLFDEGDTIKMSKLKMKFYKDLAVVKDKLYEEMGAKKFFVENPHSVRTRYSVIASVIGVAAGVAIFIGFAAQIALLISVGVGIVLVAIVLLIFSQFMPARTASGRQMYIRSLGYKMFVERAEKYRQQFFERKNLFNEVLPYAIVFGVTEKFAKAFEKMGLEPQQPSWYSGQGTFNAALFGASMASFSNSFSAAIASSPSSSGSGGGGSSGGGFGGGGGGSW